MKAALATFDPNGDGRFSRAVLRRLSRPLADIHRRGDVDDVIPHHERVFQLPFSPPFLLLVVSASPARLSKTRWT